MSVLISHPHAAPFANGTAAELERNGELGLYVVGFGAAPGTMRARAIALAARYQPAAHNRIIRGIPARRLRSLHLAEAALRTLGRASSAIGFAASTYDFLFWGHDKAVSKMRWPREIDTVYAYEDGALRTFVRAARSGMARIWDLPIPHYETLERMLLSEAQRWPGASQRRPEPHAAWKRFRKDEELKLATRITVPSAYTRESLERAGVSKRIDVIPFGFPVEQFAPKARPPDGPITVIAVGSQNLRKGTPYLLEAWKRAGLRDARLRLVGTMGLTNTFLERYRGTFEHVAQVPRTELGDVYRSADLLVLPTLGDGCPLVVQEAMCCGTPVLTTRCGNGPEFVCDGINGWMIPERDTDALVDRLREAAADRGRLFRMGQEARARAERWTWHNAGKELAAALR